MVSTDWTGNAPELAGWLICGDVGTGKSALSTQVLIEVDRIRAADRVPPVSIPAVTRATRRAAR